MKQKIAGNKLRRKGGKSRKTDLQQEILEADPAELEEILESDDLLSVFGDEELHMDYAHSISLGYFD
eukprot:416801-Rhodomonas_salina.1